MANKITSPTNLESGIFKIMITLGLFSIVNFLFYFFNPDFIGNHILFALLVISISYSITKIMYLWYNYSNITIPEIHDLNTNFSVDILTTYFPGEPLQMVVTTLEAINKITYPHTTYLCDEANDEYLKQFCKENGIIHVTRNNRKDAKAGNINNTLIKHATGDICVILDPDHIPKPNFLDPILPHFQNEEIGFVQIVQAYYNIKESLVARGAAEQTFQFYGPMMMTLNSYGSVNAIGANCVFRRAALDSIGGHAAGLCEDMHTTMLLYSKGWKAVYVPEILARGLSPSNLTNFFKQQLKWSRGTFDLLINVYPKVFKKLTFRQKIHFGMLPLHYFSGVICLINFLVPILSLFFSVSPWMGDMVDFGIILLPLAASSLFIRTYIQKWVIEKKERGFHVIGGLLHINTWWIYVVSLVYTILNKEVSYLPTPKENVLHTNYKIIIPNIILIVASLAAIIFGLREDFTPFSLIMACFALFNCGILFFGIYLTYSVTNENRILRIYLAEPSLQVLGRIKHSFYDLRNFIFHFSRRLALPLLLLLVAGTFFLEGKKNSSKWENIQSHPMHVKSNKYLGIFHPSNSSGLSDIKEIWNIEKKDSVNFNLISLYLAWNKNNAETFPYKILDSIFASNAVPMITWEPWGTEVTSQNEIALQNNKEVLKYIAEGKFDTYINEFVAILKKYDSPIFLRFAHEFDNPQYPWSPAGNNTPADFIAAWKHVFKLIQLQGAEKISMVWNPWESTSMKKYYPGDDYVDWVGFNVLNYDYLNRDNIYHSFEEIYQPFRDELNNFTNKPVLITEFGSLNLLDKQNSFINQGIESFKKYKEIRGIVFFDSDVDKNIPANNYYPYNYLDWSIKDFNSTVNNFKPSLVTIEKSDYLQSINYSSKKFPLKIKGVNYNKGKNWRNSYYALTKVALNKDFHLMKTLGINTIQFSENGIYDYNLLKYSAENNLKVIYHFNTDSSHDSIHSKQSLEKQKAAILEKIENYKNKENILGYSFDYKLENYFAKPLLFQEQQSYLSWLQSVLKDAKSIDPTKMIFLNINLNENTAQNIIKIQDILPIDSFGLTISNENQIQYYNALSSKLPVFITTISSQTFVSNFNKIENSNLLLSNWQNERTSTNITFDGLLNFYNDKKNTFGEVENLWGKNGHQVKKLTARILKPSKGLIPGSTLLYSAYILNENNWIPASKFKKYECEWILVKKDTYGNLLAIKNVGDEAELNLVIPENYKEFELVLNIKDRESNLTYSFKSTLNLHLFKANEFSSKLQGDQ